MPGVVPLATLAVAGILAIGCEAAVAPVSCPAPSAVAAEPSGGSRCIDLAERVRIRLAVERGVPTETIAQRHRLTAAAIRRIAREPGAGVLSSPGGATGLRAKPGCSLAEGRAKARLTWSPASAGKQVVIVAPEHIGLGTGRFWSGRVFGSARSKSTWHRFAGQAVHIWAVLTREPNGWRPSAPESFTGPLCAVDLQP